VVGVAVVVHREPLGAGMGLLSSKSRPIMRG